MNTRKDRLRSLFAGTDVGGGQEGSGEGNREGGEPLAQPKSVAPDAAPRRSPSGAVKAMGLSLGSLSEEVQEARRLREALAAGETIVELDIAVLERSPFIDRLSEGARNDEDFASLLQSMKEHGQQVPVLVRPHSDPDKASRGLYQIAYGHRRVQAARELGIPVRAVVRQLSDTDLVLAQGKENAERRSLSFIERAFFAKALMDHGFDRATAQAALSVHKSEMTRLLQVAEMVPLHVVQAIGPAPKAGRPRWLALGELLENDAAGLAEQEMNSVQFTEADSDSRFQHLFNRLDAGRGRHSKPGDRSRPRAIASSGGRAIAEYVRTGTASRLTIPDSAGRGFADYVASLLPRIHADFEQEKEGHDWWRNAASANVQPTRKEE